MTDTLKYAVILGFGVVIGMAFGQTVMDWAKSNLT